MTSKIDDAFNALYWEVFKGGAAGSIEVIPGKATTYFNYMLAQGKPIEWRLSAWYRGYFVQTTMMAQVGAIQMLAKSFFSHYIQCVKNRDPTTTENVAGACGAGALAAVIATPGERAIILQQNTKMNFWKTMKWILAKEGARGLTRSFGWTTMRDAIFTVAYQVAGPLSEKTFKDWTHCSEITASLFGSVPIAVLAAVISQPFETVKTNIQSHVGTNARPSSIDVVRKLGFKGLFNGIQGRGPRVFMAIPIYVAVNKWLDQ